MVDKTVISGQYAVGHVLISFGITRWPLALVAIITLDQGKHPCAGFDLVWRKKVGYARLALTFYCNPSVEIHGVI